MSAELIEADSRFSGAPVREYTVEELKDICAEHPHPAIRRIAADMLYTMGRRDQARKVVAQ